MKLLSQGVKVGFLVLLLVGGAYTVWKTIGTSPSGENTKQLSALFKDASGLPVGSRVMIAGLPVGEIVDLSIEGRFALVGFRVRNDVVVWSNAIVFKKTSSLLGSYYLEIDPGLPASFTSDGARIESRQLVDGDRIENVVEATTADELFRRIQETMPNIDAVLLSVRSLSDDMRRMVNGPMASIVNRIDDLVQSEADTVGNILKNADQSMARIEQITVDIRKVTGDADERVNRILDELDGAAKEARTLMVSARQEVEATGGKVREKLDLVDELLASSTSVVQKVDEDKGTLGRLVNDSTIADNVEEITEDAKGFVKTLTGMQTYVGLRSEYNVFAGLGRHYVTIELATRPDRYYYIEIERGPRGDYPEVTLEYDPAVNGGQYTRRVVIEDKLRFTFQFAKRLGWATIRYGIKESTGGVGLDVNSSWLHRNLRLSFDVFDMSFDQLPRVKVTAAYEVFRNIYLLAGIDEALNSPENLPIAPWPDAVDEPIQFEEYRFGRDAFFGAMLRFNDEDLTALLTVGGSAVTGLAAE